MTCPKGATFVSTTKPPDELICTNHAPSVHGGCIHDLPGHPVKRKGCLTQLIAWATPREATTRGGLVSIIVIVVVCVCVCGGGRNVSYSKEKGANHHGVWSDFVYDHLRKGLGSRGSV